MTRFEHARHGRRLWWPLILGVVGLAAIGAAAGLTLSGGNAQAQTGPCNPVATTPPAQAQELLSGVNSWRANNLQQPAMQLSAIASKAAQWFAEDMIAGQTSGHTDQYGRIWAQRLADCGFDAYWSQGSGEALAGFGSSDPTYGSTVQQAITVMTVNTPDQNAVEAPIAWQCAGVGYAANPNAQVGQDTFAWVVVATQTGPGGWGSACDAPPLTPIPTATGSTTASPSTTASASATSTATPSPTPSPTPKPTTYKAWAPMIAKD